MKRSLKNIPIEGWYEDRRIINMSPQKKKTFRTKLRGKTTTWPITRALSPDLRGRKKANISYKYTVVSLMSNFHLFWKFSGTRYIFPWRLPSKWNICNCFARVLRHLEVHVYNSTTTSRTSATFGRAEAGTIDSHSYSLSSNYNISMLQRSVAHNCHGKVFLLTAISISPRQNQFRHIMAKSISSRQNHFHCGQNTFHHGKIIFAYLIKWH